MNKIILIIALVISMCVISEGRPLVAPPGSDTGGNREKNKVTKELKQFDKTSPIKLNKLLKPQTIDDAFPNHTQEQREILQGFQALLDIWARDYVKTK